MARPKEFNPETALDKAIELFWRKGYEATSIEDLVASMDINRGSLYETFGDKQKLYASVLQHWLGEALRKYPPDGGLPDDAPSEQKLHAFVRSFLFRMLGEGTPAWHGRSPRRTLPPHVLTRSMRFCTPTESSVDVLGECGKKPIAVKRDLAPDVGKSLNPGFARKYLPPCPNPARRS